MAFGLRSYCCCSSFLYVGEGARGPDHGQSLESYCVDVLPHRAHAETDTWRFDKDRQTWNGRSIYSDLCLLSSKYYSILEGECLVMYPYPFFSPLTCLIQDPDDRQRHVQILHVFMSCYKYYLVLQNPLPRGHLIHESFKTSSPRRRKKKRALERLRCLTPSCESTVWSRCYHRARTSRY